MVPTQVMLDAVATEIAADTTVLANALFLQIFLVKAPFVPGPGLTVASLTAADFAGSAALKNTSATILKFTDPASGQWQIEVPPPVGGWHWQTTSGVTNLPQTIYGYGVMDNTGAILYGTNLLPVPLLLNANAQGIDLANIRFTLSMSALS